MTDPIDSFRDHFNDVVEEVQRFAALVRAREFHESSVEALGRLLQECTDGKQEAVTQGNEEDANAYLAFEYLAHALEEEFRFYLALRDDDPDRAWDHLVNAQSSAASAMKSHAVASHLEGYIRRLHEFERLLFPLPIFFSAGLIVREAKCSICGTEYGECNHVKGRPYMGRLCARIVTKSDLQEVSIVSDPANKRCRMLHYTENGVTRNAFSLRIVDNAEVQPPATTDDNSLDLD